MNAILTAILNGIAIGVPLIAAVWLALRISRGLVNAATRYAIWWVVLLAQIALPAFLFPRRSISIPSPSVAMSSNRIESDASSHKGATAFISTPAFRTIPPVEQKVTWNPGAWSKPIIIVWALSSIFLLFRLGLGYVALERKKRNATKPDYEQDATFQHLVAQCGVRRLVRLAVLPATEAPVAAGPFRPCVLMPQILIDTLETSELRQVYLHEVAHLARFDDVALLLQKLMETVLFFHPLVRWIARRIDFERELACDDFVVSTTGQPGSYAWCLTRVIELCGFSESSTAAAIGKKSSQLERRINMLLDETRHAGARVLRWRFALSSFLFLTIAFATTRSPQLLALGHSGFTPTRPVSTTPQYRPPVASDTPTPRAGYLAAQTALPKQSPLPANETPLGERSEVIRVPVIVTDPLRRFVTGFDKTSFRVFDNEIEQRVTGFVSDEAPVSLSIVWDVAERNEPSPQMTRLLHDKEKLLETYAKAHHPSVRRLDGEIAAAGQSDKDQASGQELVDFMTRHNPRDNFTLTRVMASADRGASLLQSIRSVNAQRAATVPDERSAILIVSDLMWTSAPGAKGELREAIGASGVPLYLIGVGVRRSVPNDSPTLPSAISLALIARESGGVEIPVAALPDLFGAVTTLTVELHNIYLLDYVRTNGPVQSGFHRIAVHMEQPRGLPELSLRYRTGYYSSR